MTGNEPFGVPAIITAVGILGITSAAASDIFRGRGGHVMPCSPVGINPAYRPDIFGNPAVAASDYGFVRSPDGTWHVGAGCGESGSRSAASAYAPRPESQKAIRQRRR